MKKILVPCDFSKPAIDAYRFALDIAVKSKGIIHLLYVIELPVLHDTTLMPVLSMEQEYMNDLKTKTEHRFEKLVRKYKTDVRVTSEVVFGSVNKTITDYAEEKALDTIIMGSHGSSGVKEFFIGSNTEKIVRHSLVPVFVLKEFYEGPIEKIILPVSFEIDDQKEFIAKINSIQSFFEAHLLLVWINTPALFTADTITIKRLELFAKRFGLKKFSIHIFNDFDEPTGIMNFTDINKGDLILMGTHARKGIAHLLSGSITEDVVNRVKCPIMTCKISNT